MFTESEHIWLQRFTSLRNRTENIKKDATVGCTLSLVCESIAVLLLILQQLFLLLPKQSDTDNNHVFEQDQYSMQYSHAFNLHQAFAETGF